MDAYKEFIEPSRISQCLGCNFISPSEKHLIVGKGTLLQIFQIIRFKTRQSKKQVEVPKLNLIQQYKLQGLITDIKAVRTNENRELDYLLISTEVAKVSLIKWDHYGETITTVSLHFYESALENNTYEELSKSELIVDPNSLCSCLRFKNLLTFLPFPKALDDEEQDADNHIDNDFENNLEHELLSLGSGKEIFELSFVIDAKSLDSRLGDIIDIQFLHNYSEPTLAILSAQQNTWAGLLPKVKDNVSYVVLSLNLASKTSTTVLKIDGLPFDIDKVVALPAPLNGSLLMGCNELIHINGGGVTKRVAVNQYTSTITNSIKGYYDQSSLNLKLENSSVQHLHNTNKIMLILSDGNIHYLNFEIDGKRIKNIYLEEGMSSRNLNISFPGDIAMLERNLLFISCKNSNNYLVEVLYEESDSNTIDSKTPTLSDQEEDDDLYKDEEIKELKVVRKRIKELQLLDTLLNNGPISNFTLGKYSTEKFKSSLPNPNQNEVCVVTNSGSHSGGSLNIFVPSVQPTIRSSLSFSQVNRMWIVGNEYLITSDDANSKSEIFQINKSYARLSSKHFINDESSIGIHEIGKSGHIVQVTPKKIMVYNNKFKKIMSFNKELKKYKNDEIIQSTFNDEFLMVFFASGEVGIYSINTYNESFSKVKIPKILNDTILTTGYIANSKILNAILKDINLAIENSKNKKRKFNANSAQASPTDESTLGPKQKTFILVTGDNRIVVFTRFHNEKCFQLDEIENFSEYLSLVFFEPKDTYPDPYIKNIVLNELGDEISKDEYLTILTVGGEIIMYKLFFDGVNYKFIKEKDIPITGTSHNAYAQLTSIERRLLYFPNINGYTSLFVTGLIPYFITKTSHSIPRIFKFTKMPAISFSSYSDSKISSGLIYLDNNKNARICEIPNDFIYEQNWPLKKISIDETIKSVTYHEASHTYVVACYTEVPYKCIDEEGKPIVGIDETRPLALSYKGSIKLISPYNWSVIDKVELEDNEIGLNVKSMILDVGSSTKKFKNRKELIVVGCGKYRMEDLSANGSFKIFEIIDIVPEPGRPETNHKFKEIHQEDTKGAVTSICEVSGRLLVSQGQKIIVRDLQDDGVVPVAFFDTSVYVSEAKSFGNLVILGDSLKSVWLTGFDAEPFRMILLGKDLQTLDVSCADFIVKDEEVFFVVGDNNNVIHVMKYDPEDPASFNGQRIICKSSFRINSNPSCFVSIPKIEEFNPSSSPTFQTIGSTIDGSLFVVFPVNEATYRRMYVLQQQLTDKEYHPCGLNPKLNRIGRLRHAADDINTKPMLDYDLIRYFSKLKEDRKLALAQKLSSKNILADILKDLIEFENVLKYL